MLETMLIKILTKIAMSLLAERVLISLGLNTFAAIFARTKTKRDDAVLADVAETLGRPDIAEQLRKEIAAAEADRV